MTTRRHATSDGRRPGARRRTLPIGLGLVALATLAACGGDSVDEVAIPNVFDLSHDPTSAIPVFDAAATDVMPADLLRNRLEKELTWHGITLTQVMRAAHAGDSSVDAWIAELTANTDDMTAAVGVVYGRDAAFAFNQQWAQHTQFLVDYAVAIAAGDEDGADEARDHLALYARDSGSFFAEVTDNALPADAVRELLDTHVSHMLSMIEAVDRGDDLAALELAIEDSRYLGDIAQGLSTAFAGQNSPAFPGAVETPESLYCTIITRETGAYVLRELFVPGSDAAAAFEAATQVPLAEVVGVIDQLQADDPVLVAQTADLALDRAFDHARPALEP
jgi:hypothetical protein